MKSIRHTLTLLLAAVFIYSAIGHAMVLHYCNHSKEVCKTETACCSDMEKSPCHDNIPSEGNSILTDRFVCCEISNQYLVNPFAVRQPDQKQEIAAAEIALIYINQSIAAPVFSENSQPVFLPDSDASTGREILLDCKVLII
jgi:hypothetical protein